ncbi:MAG: glycosyltransferase family 39 protein [Candidatus Sumerlaeaceae bacterium]|nr:glycosyltransferase family 39 protein [Candidatus Sumerlaeaceae bacterium]
MQPMTAKEKRILAGIVILGALLRLLFLGSNPPALFRDEAEKGYNAWSLATTGRDLSGQFLPLFINVFGVTTSAIYQYAAAPLMALAGPGEWTVRLPAALAGIATLALAFALVRRERGNEAALWAAAFLALSPWHIPFSRWAQQGIFLPLFLTAAMLGWRRFLDGSRFGLPIAAVCLGLALYSYEVARFFVPALTLLIAVLYWRELAKRWKQTLVSAALFALVAAPTVRLLLFQNQAAQARFNAISIFGDHAGFSEVAGRSIGNYLSHFSLSFLLMAGDGELRHSAGIGMLTAMELAAVCLGLGVMLRRRQRADIVWLGWLALAPVAASLTKVGIPHALRTIVALPAIQVVAGVGVESFLHHVRESRRDDARRFMALAALASFGPFAYIYFSLYPGRSAINWQYGVKQALEVLREEGADSANVVFYNVQGAEYLAPFYDKLPPRAYQSGGLAASRYRFPAFGALPEAVCTELHGPTAIVTLPIFRFNCAVAGVPIEAPSSRQPAMVLYLNDALSRQWVPADKASP